MMLENSRRGRASPSPSFPPLICIACWNAWTGPINGGAVLCFGCKASGGGLSYLLICLIWKQWCFAINGTCGLFGVKLDFLLGCLHLDAICQLYCGRRGSILAWFYSKFVMGPIQELKVNMVIYLHARKQAHVVRRSWWLLEWRSQLALCAAAWCEGSLS